jgi:hypothetical protein
VRQTRVGDSTSHGGVSGMDVDEPMAAAPQRLGIDSKARQPTRQWQQRWDDFHSAARAARGSQPAVAGLGSHPSVAPADMEAPADDSPAPGLVQACEGLLSQRPASQLAVASQPPLKAPRLCPTITRLCGHLKSPPGLGSPRYRDRDRCGLIDPLDTCTTGCGRGRADTSSCFCCLDCSGEGTAQAQHSGSCDERHRLQLQRWREMVDGDTHGTAIPQLRDSSGAVVSLGNKDTNEGPWNTLAKAGPHQRVCEASVSSAEPDRSNVVMAEPEGHVYGSKPLTDEIKLKLKQLVDPQDPEPFGWVQRSNPRRGSSSHSQYFGAAKAKFDSNPVVVAAAAKAALRASKRESKSAVAGQLSVADLQPADVVYHDRSNEVTDDLLLGDIGAEMRSHEMGYDDARARVNKRYGMPESYGEHPSQATLDYVSNYGQRFSNYAEEPDCFSWAHENLERVD